MNKFFKGYIKPKTVKGDITTFFLMLIVAGMLAYAFAELFLK